jgi:hypothetical protein
MDPAISQAIATFIGALTTAVLLYATYMWGPNSRRKKDDDTDEES